MNPLMWKREHKLALGLATIIGCVVGLVVGYFAFSSSGGEGYYPPGVWLSHPMYYRVYWWALGGGIVGGGLVYIRQLMRS